MYSTPTYNQISEQDVRSFLREAPRTRFAVPTQLLSGIAVTTGIAALLFFALNAQSFFMVNSIDSLTTSAATVSLPAVSEPTPTPTPTALAVVTTPEPTPEAPSIPVNTLSIAELGISAPIAWNSPMDIKAQSKLLNQGLVHIAGTALPGEKGMAAISGHSSNYPWIKSSYNSVFAPLVKAQIGQTIELNYNNRLFRYRITKSYEVKPDQVSILSDHSTTGIRLITCTPVGTSLRRLIVEAEQITPDPSGNTAFTPATFNAPALSGR